MWQTDSLSQTASEAADTVHKVQLKHPYQVLRMLPRNATPAQQDSAIQAVFHPEFKNLSTRPDTLHLPGHDKGKSIKDVSLPQYYKETFFSNNPMLHPELDYDRFGMAGDPIPYNIRNDDVITSLLLASFIFMLLGLSRLRQFILSHVKGFFYVRSGNNRTSASDTGGEMRFLSLLALLGCMLMAVLSFLYTQEYVADTFILSSPYMLIFIFFGCFTAYNLIKIGLYSFVGWVFFQKSDNELWIKSYLLILSVETIVLLPIVLLQSYFDLSSQSAVFYAAIIIILAKILAFYKSLAIFFVRKSGFLQIILYFCALEITPLLALWGISVFIVDYLKINY